MFCRSAVFSVSSLSHKAQGDVCPRYLWLQLCWCTDWPISLSLKIYLIFVKVCNATMQCDILPITTVYVTWNYTRCLFKILWEDGGASVISYHSGLAFVLKAMTRLRTLIRTSWKLTTMGGRAWHLWPGGGFLDPVIPGVSARGLSWHSDLTSLKHGQT